MFLITKRIGFVIALVAIMCFSAGAGYWFNDQQHRAESVEYAKMKDQLRNRAHAVIPHGSDGFNPITIDIADGIAVVKLYEFETERDCYGTVYFGERPEEDTLLLNGCVDGDGKITRVYGGS